MLNTYLPAPFPVWLTVALLRSCHHSAHPKPRRFSPLRSARPQEKEAELEEKQREMRQRLLVAGNAAAADALLIKPQGFDWASDFKARTALKSVRPCAVA